MAKTVGPEPDITAFEQPRLIIFSFSAFIAGYFFAVADSKSLCK